ncbi:MAG: hypothetical protein WA751_02880 [Candidatus Dormiibacterota bacterium]
MTRDATIHAPWYPNHPLVAPRVRVTAILTEEGRLLCEDGRAWSPRSYRKFVDTLERENLDVYGPHPLDWPWLDQAAEDDRCDPIMNRRGQPVALRWKVGSHGKMLWYVSGKTSWYNFRPKVTWLRAKRRAEEALGVGCQPLPGLLGDATQRLSWTHSFGRRRETRPNRTVCQALLKHGAHARIESDISYRGDVWELDRNAAYPASWTRLPSGRISWVGGFWPDPDSCATWYGEVEITRETPAQFGCFPVREGKSVSYPRQAGTYRSWLWKEEADQAMREGCSVKVLESCWAWSEWSESDKWATEVYGKRIEVDPEARAFVKMASVAAIGRHGRGPERVGLSDEAGHRVGSEEGGWSVTSFKDWDRVLLLHWYSFSLMAQRLALYQMMVELAGEGIRVLGCDTDAIYCADKPQAAHRVSGLGGWKLKLLRDCKWLANRCFVSVDRTRLPGFSGATRARALAAHDPPLP